MAGRKLETIVITTENTSREFTKLMLEMLQKYPELATASKDKEAE